MPIEVNGHSWETNQRRTRRARDIRFLQCSKCGASTRVYMRSMTPEADLAKEKPCPGVSMGTMVPHPVCPLCPPGGSCPHT